MGYFQNINHKVLVLMIGICTFAVTSHAFSSHAIKAKTGMNGQNEIISVWFSTDSETGHSKIQGKVGLNSSISTDLTSPSIVHAINPKLAVASASTDTQAAAAWLAFEHSTEVQTIQATVATQAGWNGSATVHNLSLTNGTEIPKNVEKVIISSDGYAITVLWSSYMPHLHDTVIRAATSNDGGRHWIHPINVSE